MLLSCSDAPAAVEPDEDGARTTANGNETVEGNTPAPDPVAGSGTESAQPEETALEAGWKAARCDVESADAQYEGPCAFRAGQGGSFSLRRENATAPLLGTIITITVTLVGDGSAEVRGLTGDGINSRWGMAKRSDQDAACWAATDFRVCAY